MDGWVEQRLHLFCIWMARAAGELVRMGAAREWKGVEIKKVNSGQDAAGGSPGGFCSMASAALQAGGRDEAGGSRAARTNSRTREGRLDAWDRVWYGEI